MSWPFPGPLTCQQRCILLLACCVLALIPLAIILICEGPPKFLKPSQGSHPIEGELNQTAIPGLFETTQSPIRRRRSAPPSCTPSSTRMITLCVPDGGGLVVELAFSSFPQTPVASEQKHMNWAVFLANSVWYITLGDWSKWTWSNSISETDNYDWSSYSKGQAAVWRSHKNLTLNRKPGPQSDGLIITLAELHLKSCQQFILAPWSDRSAIYWQLEICPTTGSTPSAAITVDELRVDGDSTPRANRLQSAKVRMTMIKNMTTDDLFNILTGVSGSNNNWLLMAEQAAKNVDSDCVVCMGPRPSLKVVPAPIDGTCLLYLMNNTKPAPQCSHYAKCFPKTPRSVSNKPPFFSSDVAPNNFTCVNLTGAATHIGDIDPSWCLDFIAMKPNFRPTARADLWWYCGGRTLYDGFPKDASGICALITLLLPVTVLPVQFTDRPMVPDFPTTSRHKRSVVPGNAQDPTYIDAVGIPRGVPDEYKLANQVTAGWASILPWITINANVDRINYIHFNVQLLANYTRDGLEAIHAQLSATSLMAFQNRIAVDLLLAEKGGVCSIFGQDCCVFIPNNTAPDGSLTKAITGLTALSNKMKEHSGVDTELWDAWGSMFGKYKTLFMSLLISLSVFVAIIVTCGCCCIPCIRALMQKLIVTAFTREDGDFPLQMLLLSSDSDPLPTAPPLGPSDDDYFFATEI